MAKQRYIPRQRDRIEEVMTDRLNQIKLGDTATIEVSGPHYVPPFMTPQGQPVLGWTLTLYLAHNKLIGQPPVFVSGPIGALMLDDVALHSLTDQMLEKARQARAEVENPQAQQPDAAAMMRELQARAPVNGSGPKQ